MRKQYHFAAMALPAIALMAISAQAQDMNYGQTEDLTPDQDPMVTQPDDVIPPENSMMTEPEEEEVLPGQEQDLLRAQAEEVQDTEDTMSEDWSTAETENPMEPADSIIEEPEPVEEMASMSMTTTQTASATDENTSEDFADHGFKDMDTNSDGVLTQEEYVVASTGDGMTSEQRAIEIFEEAAGDDDRLTYYEFVTPQG